MYKLVFFVPATHAEEVKEAVFNAGAGRIGDYSHCCWQVLGTGQFKPLEGSDPYLGSQGELEKVEEFRIEMVCSDDRIKYAIQALKQSHPYEEPAFDVWQLAET